MNRMIAFLPLMFLAGCGSGGGDAGDKADPVARVRIAPATMGATAEQTIVYGATEAGPGGERSLIAPAEAIVDRILAPNGTAVRAGAVVATLKPSRTTATDLAKASADAASSNAAYARARRLRADGLASDADVETARAAAETARATLANLGAGRTGMMLRAPIAGIVQGLTAKTGDQVAAGTTVASIAVKGNLRAHFGIDPAIAQRVKLGQPLELSSVSGVSHATVAVDGVDTQVDPTTRLASVYGDVPAGFDVGPGEALRGSLSLAAQANGLTIPYSALLDDGGRSYVFVIKDGVAHEQDVSPGSSTGDRIQILKGLAAGDKVVTEGGTALEDGMKVAEQGAAR
ncbi:efflux RND transporter periplasmic adaptor subunit [Sphingomonas sp. CGMCC 1.13654]|uniref:Efflux RND transporter periplasmic adaptor subunit n=1 Tax=Sphingomonas chungangi TaxID=2683589 RepID=A0A838L9Y5_9SPHN|nr:efflux RND transporter periplasmic adaptor subunit [Sphingomonas chungangi]MBA2934318.1 efflux RND transporter periplasmic adaptor subunit [Sphingomonas chungangi]